MRRNYGTSSVIGLLMAVTVVLLLLLCGIVITDSNSTEYLSIIRISPHDCRPAERSLSQFRLCQERVLLEKLVQLQHVPGFRRVEPLYEQYNGTVAVGAVAVWMDRPLHQKENDDSNK